MSTEWGWRRAQVPRQRRREPQRSRTAKRRQHIVCAFGYLCGWVGRGEREEEGVKQSKSQRVYIQISRRLKYPTLQIQEVLFWSHSVTTYTALMEAEHIVTLQLSIIPRRNVECV